MANSLEVIQNMEVERMFIGAGCNRVVNNVSWGASGLVSFGAQNAVAIFCPKTAQILTTLPGHKASVNCTLWLPNSKFAFKGIEKEISALQSEEKKLVSEIKRTAKTGNETATKVLARQLIRHRQQIANLQGSQAQMRGIATHTQAISAQSSVAAGMKGATKAMTALEQMDPAKQAKVMQDFQRQSAQLDMTTEMMSDAIDDAIDDDEAEQKTEDLTNQVLDEIGVDVASQLSAAPKGKIAGKKTEESSSSGIDELEKRLAALRNP